MGDPGTGGIRYDNALPSATTNLAISTLTADTGNPNVKAFLLTLDDSSHSPRSTIQLRSASSAGVFTQFGVTGAIVDNGTWLQIPVTPTSSNGAPAASASLYSIFALSGDNGLGAVGSVSAANTTIDVSGTASAVLLARAALTGDVTAAASSNATNIAASAVTSAKIAASAVNSAAISANAVSLDKLATQAANTILTNATSASAVPSALALAASTVLGRDSTGNVSALTLSGLTAVGGVLTASSGPSLAQVHSMVYA